MSIEKKSRFDASRPSCCVLQGLSLPNLLLLLWRVPSSSSSWARDTLGGVSSMSESSLGPRSVIFFDLDFEEFGFFLLLLPLLRCA